jgi:two-component system sensor histidine kinase SenX3
LPPFVGDREYLISALIQLLDNAVKFSPREKPIIIGAHAQEHMLHLWVKDEGRGVPATSVDEIWESFHQAERDQFEDQGAGSGLAIVRGVATLHNGKVTVTSERGAGSTFTMILPMQAQDAVTPTRASAVGR